MDGQQNPRIGSTEELEILLEKLQSFGEEKIREEVIDFASINGIDLPKEIKAKKARQEKERLQRLAKKPEEIRCSANSGHYESCVFHKLAGAAENIGLPEESREFYMRAISCYIKDLKIRNVKEVNIPSCNPSYDELMNTVVGLIKRFKGTGVALKFCEKFRFYEFAADLASELGDESRRVINLEQEVVRCLNYGYERVAARIVRSKLGGEKRAREIEVNFIRSLASGSRSLENSPGGFVPFNNPLIDYIQGMNMPQEELRIRELMGDCSVRTIELYIKSDNKEKAREMGLMVAISSAHNKNYRCAAEIYRMLGEEERANAFERLDRLFNRGKENGLELPLHI